MAGLGAIHPPSPLVWTRVEMLAIASWNCEKNVVHLNRFGETFMTRIDGIDAELCEKLKALGYAERNQIRIYGEEFDLLSNPISDEHGFSIEAKSHKSGEARRLRIPLSILYMMRKELQSRDLPVRDIVDPRPHRGHVSDR
jgi:hypothetical protein